MGYTLSTTRVGTSAAVAGLLVAMAVAGPAAQRRRADNSVHGAPVATNTIARTPDRYYGKLITVSAAVDKMLSKTMFVVDQRRAAGPSEVQAVGTPLLVIAPRLIAALEPNRYFLVRGELAKFSAAALTNAAAGYAPDLTTEALAKYEGQPVLIASSILDSRYAELAGAPAAPATASATRAAGSQ